MTRHVVFPLLAIYFQRKFQILIQRKDGTWNFPEFSTSLNLLSFVASSYRSSFYPSHFSLRASLITSFFSKEIFIFLKISSVK